METTNTFKFTFRNSKREALILEKTSYSFKLQVNNITKSGKKCIGYINYTIDDGMTITDPDGSPYSKDPKYLLPPVSRNYKYGEKLNEGIIFDYVNLLLALSTEDKPYFHLATFLYLFLGEVAPLKSNKTVYLFEIFSREYSTAVKSLELAYTIPNISILNGLVNVKLLQNKFAKLDLYKLINLKLRKLIINLTSYIKESNNLVNSFYGKLPLYKDFKKSAYNNIAKSFNKLNKYYEAENKQPDLEAYSTLLENKYYYDGNGFTLYYYIIFDYVNCCYKHNRLVDSQKSAQETIYEFMRNKQDLTFNKDVAILKNVFDHYTNISPIHKELINKQRVEIFYDLFAGTSFIKRVLQQKSFPWFINTPRDFNELVYGSTVEKYTRGFKNPIYNTVEKDTEDLLKEMYIKLNKKIFLSTNIFKNTKYNEYLKRINETGVSYREPACADLISEFKDMIVTDFSEYIKLNPFSGENIIARSTGSSERTGVEEDIKNIVNYLITGDLKSLKELVLVRLFNHVFTGLGKDTVYRDKELLLTLHLTHLLFPDLLNWDLVSDAYKTVKRDYLPVGNNKLTITGSHNISSYVERSDSDYTNFRPETITSGSLTALSHLSNLYLDKEQVEGKSDAELGKSVFEKLKTKLEQGTDFTISYPKNTSQLFNEGSTLNNCVYSYCDLIVRGESAVLFMRDKNEPDTPLYTVELDEKTGEIIQLSGLNDTVPPLSIIKKINSVLPVSLKLSKFEIEKLN